MINPKNTKILVVDDEPEICDILEKFLTARGYRVRKASGAEEALDIMESDDIHMMLLDIKMPKITGVELLKIVKKRQPLVEVIMITGHATLEDAITCMKEGARDFIVKPFALEYVADAVKNALEKRTDIIEHKNYLGNLERKIRNVTTEIKKIKGPKKK